MFQHSAGYTHVDDEEDGDEVKDEEEDTEQHGIVFGCLIPDQNEGAAMLLSGKMIDS